MAKISINVDDQTLKTFDSMWKNEGWGNRQEAIVYLMRSAISRGFISKEKSELAKIVKGEKA